MTADANEPAYEGCHDRADCGLISGWARDRNNPDTPVSVDIFDDETLLATVKAGDFRQDLQEAGKGMGKCAFHFRVPRQLKDGKPHLIRVKVAGSNFSLDATPIELNCRHDVSEGLPRCILRMVAQVAQRTQTLPLFEQVTAKLQGEEYRPLPMKVHIVCYENIDAWILGKIARKLAESLQTVGIDVDISKAPDPHADINHHIIYYDYDGRKTSTETLMITHIDIYGELRKVKEQLVNAEMGICMSFEAVHRLAHFGVPREKLCYINPAHDGVMRPRKIVVGIFTRIYPDGCKREHLLKDLSERISLEDFRFRIMGSGWDTIADGLRQKGIEVDYLDHFDHQIYCEWMPNLDYFLYLGQDEGSIGFLDALAAGVPTIVAPQGFHLDVPGGITHAFHSIGELEQIFYDIAEQKKRRVSAVSSWTWAEYARKHVLVWDYLLKRKAGETIPHPLIDALGELGVLTTLYQ